MIHRRSSTTPLVALLGVALSACTADETADLPLGSAEQALEAGDPEPTDPPLPPPPLNDGTPCNHPSVVYMSRGSGGSCTGILIGPQAVLTAAHCLHDNGQMIPAAEISYGVGGNACQQGNVDAVGYLIHDDYDDTTHLPEVDLAVVRLATPIPGATYAQFRITTPQAGNPVTLIGFGSAPNDPATNTQRCQSATIVEARPDLITTDRVVCGGDSGGPVLDAAGRIIGTIGSTDNVACGPSQPGQTYAGFDMGFIISALGYVNTPGNMGCNNGETRSCRPAGGACFTEETVIGEDACHLGTSTCQNNQWGGCEGFVGPTEEACNFIDDDCDGDTDENCAPACGDDLCNGAETHETCPDDCSPPFSCPPGRMPSHTGGTGMICVCIPGCPGQTQHPDTCECTTPGTCGNGVCDYPAELDTCPADCGWCGDGFCSIHEEDGSCPYDCGSATCGDGWCDFGEDEWSCATDCGGGSTCICNYDCPPATPGCEGVCGDGVCDLVSEDSSSCPSDCYLGGGGDPGGWGDPWDHCSDEAYWGAWIDTYGWGDAVAAYEMFCMLAQ